MLGHISRFGRRLVVMIGGEAMQSAFHLGLNIAVLHVMPAHDYGVFAIVMVIGGLGLTYVRALTAMPASIFIGRAHRAKAADAYDVTFGSGALALASVLGLLTTVALHLWLGSAAVAGGLFVGLWSFRSHLRTAIFARGQSVPVAIGDLVYTLGGISLTAAILTMWREEHLWGMLSVLALANAGGIAAILLVARRPVRISFRASVRRRFVTLWRRLGWSLVGVTTTNLQGQGLALLVATMAGPAAYAPIAATFVLFAPLRIVATALVNLIQPVLSAQLARREMTKVWHQLLAWTVTLGCVAIAFGGLTMLILPLLRVQALEGTPVRLMGGCAWAIFTSSLLYVMPRITLEAIGAFRAIALITASSAVVGTAAIAGILLVAPPAWSLLGALTSELIVLALSWIVVRRKVTALPSESAPRSSAFDRLAAPGRALS